MNSTAGRWSGNAIGKTQQKRADAEMPSLAEKHKQTDRQAAVLGSLGHVTQDEYECKRGKLRGLTD